MSKTHEITLFSVYGYMEWCGEGRWMLRRTYNNRAAAQAHVDHIYKWFADHPNDLANFTRADVVEWSPGDIASTFDETDPMGWGKRRICFECDHRWTGSIACPVDGCTGMGEVLPTNDTGVSDDTRPTS